MNEKLRILRVRFDNELALVKPLSVSSMTHIYGIRGRWVNLRGVLSVAPCWYEATLWLQILWFLSVAGYQQSQYCLNGVVNHPFIPFFKFQLATEILRYCDDCLAVLWRQFSLCKYSHVVCVCVCMCVDALVVWQGPMEEQYLHWMVLPCMTIFEIKNGKRLPHYLL